jgi:hypothetical protein
MALCFAATHLNVNRVSRIFLRRFITESAAKRIYICCNIRQVPDMPHVLVWDIETVPDLAGFAAANGHDGKSDDEIRAELGDKFPKHIYHSIICIGALIAHQQDDHWVVDALGAPHVGERSERDLIAAFVARIAELNRSS